MSDQLFGRDKDIEAIAACLAEGQDVALVAPAGMGKTTAALEVLRRLAHSGWLTAWVPAAMTASVTDLAEVVASQLGHASRRSTDQELKAIIEEIDEGPEEPEHHLGLALEGFALSAEQLHGRAALVVDDLDTLFDAGRSRDVGTLFARKLRSVRQRSTALSVLFLMRSDATLRDVFADSSAPLFGGAKTHRLESLPASACEDLIENRIREAGGQLTEEALSRFVTSCRGIPLYLALAADAAAAASSDTEEMTVDLRDAESALAEAFRESAQATAVRIESIRRSHRLGLEVARRLATGNSPYAGEKAPNNVTRALRNLERLGLAYQPGAREWALTDPFLEEALRGFDPKAIAARTSTALGSLPSSLPSSERTVSRLRGNDVWGLRRHWFEPSTVIRDGVYGDIKLTRLERAIIETREFQRLRRMRHLGAVQLVYPDATHSRMTHSLGVLAASASLLESMIRGEGQSDLLTTPALPEDRLNWHEALALARIGGLVHELATIPFGATLEAELEPHLTGYPARLERLWLAVVADLAQAGLSDSEADALANGRFRLNLWQAFDEARDLGEGEYLFIRDLLRGPLSANSLDGAARGRQALGLPPSSRGRLAAAMQLVEAEKGGRTGCRVAVRGVDRADVSSELMEHFLLLARHREAITGHRTTRAADAMLAAASYYWIGVLQDRERGDARRAALHAEDRLLSCSDDGFIDYLLDFSAAGETGPDGEEGEVALAALRHLVEGLARRRLYRLVATAGGRGSVADQLFSEFGPVARRRSLEREAAQAASISDPGRILLVVPQPPRPSFGNVLVSDEDGVSPLRSRHSKLATDVEGLDDLQVRLWSIDVFADPHLSAKQRHLALDWLASRLRLRWEWNWQGDEEEG